MITKPPPSFEHAARYEAELNERQRQVLRLIAAGQTNGEIAEALEMTLAGAKWNVSEILSKLGLATREEAAAFYRWHTRPARRARRFARALLAFGSARATLAAGSAGMVAVAAVGAWLLIGDPGSNAVDVPGRPFYLEASSIRTETNGDASGLKTQVQTKWWYRDATHQQVEQQAPVAVALPVGWKPGDIRFETGVSLSVSDGASTWRPSGHFFFRDELPPPGPAEWRSGLTMLGPVTASTVDGLLDVIRSSNDGEWARIAGTGRVLGRETTIVEYGTTAPGPDQKPAQRSIGKFWIDSERMFILRSEQGAGGPLSFTYEVTLLRYNQVQPEERFTWTPPPGTVEIVCNRPTASMPRGLLPEGFLGVPPEVIPPGFGAISFGANADDNGRCGSANVRLEPPPPGNPDPRFIEVNESLEQPDSLLPNGRDDTRTVADAIVAYAARESGDVVTLAWVHDGLGVQLKSNVLTVEELVAFANALLSQ